MMLDEPRPKFPFPGPRLRGPVQRMTLIGAINCGGGAVLLADRQETITDYAKWDCCKITQFELKNAYRFFLSGAGRSDSIEMVKDHLKELWGADGEYAALASASDVPEVRKMIIRAVREVTIEAQLGDSINLIWAIQKVGVPSFDIDLFYTSGLHVNKIRRHYFSGNPMLLTRYLSDMYLEGKVLGTDEAEALAAYFLWEAKEYDPTVGKHSDIVTLLYDGSIRRMTRPVEGYWEKHFFELKKAMSVLPVLSCVSVLGNRMYDPKEHLERFNQTLVALIDGQKKMRTKPPAEHPLTKKLRQVQKKIAAKHFPRRFDGSPITQSGVQKPEDQP